MYTVDKNNAIKRNSDSKVIPRDITNVEYQNFLYAQQYKIDPLTGNRVSGFVNKSPSKD